MPPTSTVENAFQSPSPTKPVVVQTPTPTFTSAPTETPAPTNTPTPTKTPVPTSTVVVVALPPLDTLITSLDGAYLQEGLAILNEQFVGGIEKELNSYHFFGVGGEIITHETPIQLPEGYEISHTFALQYLDAAGNDQVVHVPIHAYNRDENEAHLLGYGIARDEYMVDIGGMSRIDLDVKGLTNLALGTIGKLQRVGWTGPGHIFYVAFAVPDGDEFSQLSGQGFLNNTMGELYSAESLAEFARTGNPEILVKIPGEDGYLLLPVNIDMKNAFAYQQQLNFDGYTINGNPNN